MGAGDATTTTVGGRLIAWACPVGDLARRGVDEAVVTTVGGRLMAWARPTGAAARTTDPTGTLAGTGTPPVAAVADVSSSEVADCEGSCAR